MKTFKPRKIAPSEMLRVVGEVAPDLPTALASRIDKPATLSMRFKESTIASLQAMATERGTTMKQALAELMRAGGVEVAEADMEDRTPKRGRART